MEHLSLVCCETDIGGKAQRAIADPVLLNDNRVLANLLATEDKYVPRTSYFNCVQTDIQSYMRKMVTEWMAEVCSEQRMEEEVFPLSVNYLDRFLCLRDIKRTQLQLLGAACMFLASKLKETSPISGEQLVVYTDNSITLDDLTKMESLVLQLLKWDLSAIVPNDFLDHILHRMPFDKHDVRVIKKHAQTFAALCATDCNFMLTPPSMIACAAIGSALKTLRGHSAQDLYSLHLITRIDVELIRACMEQVETTVRSCMSMLSPPSAETTPTKTGESSPQQEQPTTPTDVREINIMMESHNQVSASSSSHHDQYVHHPYHHQHQQQAIPFVY
ncbi:G1/S-specific cyclin-D2 [Elysia marginata]|uniref:G1/S-specific cyclin-D2 n=1 Tax=Elysia marginata TaxID=1093978 RepID=A0AAV4IB25_9GAST|nr:G1/S-specific cyclin-D2 [Elysia marginata]